MSRIINLNTPIDTPFGNVGKLHWNWKPPKKNVEYSPNTKIAEMKLQDDGEVISIPVRIIPVDHFLDAAIICKDKKNTTFWIKQELLEHIYTCDKCLKYVITHEFTHTGKNFQFEFPNNMRSLGEERVYMIYHYLVDAWVDKWNIINNNYSLNAPIKFISHMEKKKEKNFESNTRENFFENYMYLAKFTSHCKGLKDNLYQHTYCFPYEFQEKYQKLLDILSTDYKGPDQNVYCLIKDIAELILNQGILDDYLSEPSDTNKFSFSYFINNNGVFEK